MKGGNNLSKRAKVIGLCFCGCAMAIFMWLSLLNSIWLSFASNPNPIQVQDIQLAGWMGGIGISLVGLLSCKIILNEE